ncbi:hypothetical protein TNCV_3063881 [Trichonephila clavipes]|nr:hypothetical protein TNCV_3063881 [Trichonephila clavipes]
MTSMTGSSQWDCTDEAYPLCGHGRMDGDPYNALDSTNIRYWKARRQMGVWTPLWAPLTIRVNEKIPKKDEDVIVEQIPKISHSVGLKAVEAALLYSEQQGVSVMNLLLLRRLRDKAEKRSRVQYRRKHDITHLYF